MDKPPKVAGWYPVKDWPGWQSYWDGTRWSEPVQSQAPQPPAQAQPPEPASVDTGPQSPAQTQGAVQPPPVQQHGSPPPPIPPPVGAQSRKSGTPGWVKALVIIGGILLTMIVGCAALIGVGVNEAGKELEEESSGDISDESEVKETATVGQPLTLKGTTYEVTSVDKSQSVGDSFTKEEANGTFVTVKLKLTNEKDDPATISESAITMVGGNDKAYSTSDDALLAVDDQFLLEEIQPGLSEEGTLVYDLPSAALSGAELQVEDLFSDDKGRIALGL